MRRMLQTTAYLEEEQLDGLADLSHAMKIPMAENHSARESTS